MPTINSNIRQKLKEELQIHSKISDEDQNDNLIQPFSISKSFKTHPINNSLKAKPNDIHDPRTEIKLLKQEIKYIKENLQRVETKNQAYETQMYLNQIDKGKGIVTEIPSFSLNEITISTTEPSNSKFISAIQKFNYQKWFILITLAINNSKETFTAMVDSGADHSVIRDGIFPTKYYESTEEKLVTANDSPLKVMGKLTKILICNEKICFKHQFIVIDDLNTDVILGIPFLTQIYPFWVDSNGLSTKIMGQRILFNFITPIRYKELNTLQTNSIYQSINLIQRKQNKILYLQDDILYHRINQLLEDTHVQQRIKKIQDLFTKQICSDIPNAFWERKKHIVNLPYEKDFSERNIPTKARPIQMNHDLLEICKKELQTLLAKKLIRPSKSPWSCAGFYVINQAERERGAPRLVINYKPLNKVL